MNSRAKAHQAYVPTDIEHLANVVTHGVCTSCAVLLHRTFHFIAMSRRVQNTTALNKEGKCTTAARVLRPPAKKTAANQRKEHPKIVSLGVTKYSNISYITSTRIHQVA